jgi:hypothetical protein
LYVEKTKRSKNEVVAPKEEEEVEEEEEEERRRMRRKRRKNKTQPNVFCGGRGDYLVCRLHNSGLSRRHVVSANSFVSLHYFRKYYWA